MKFKSSFDITNNSSWMNFSFILPFINLRFSTNKLCASSHFLTLFWELVRSDLAGRNIWNKVITIWISRWLGSELFERKKGLGIISYRVRMNQLMVVDVNVSVESLLRWNIGSKCRLRLAKQPHTNFVNIFYLSRVIPVPVLWWRLSFHHHLSNWIWLIKRRRNFHDWIDI